MKLENREYLIRLIILAGLLLMFFLGFRWWTRVHPDMGEGVIRIGMTVIPFIIGVAYLIEILSEEKTTMMTAFKIAVREIIMMVGAFCASLAIMGALILLLVWVSEISGPSITPCLTEGGTISFSPTVCEKYR